MLHSLIEDIFHQISFLLEYARKKQIYRLNFQLRYISNLPFYFFEYFLYSLYPTQNPTKAPIILKTKRISIKVSSVILYIVIYDNQAIYMFRQLYQYDKY